MENLPIDTISLPSRIFYSEEEDKVYVGEPGDYKEVGGGDFIPVSEKAQPNGVATLDGGGKIPATQLPNSVMTLEGEWNADTNTPTLTNGTGNAGMVYEVTTAGTTDFGDGDITFAVGDWAVYGADGKWYKSLNSNEVTSVNGKTGTVVLTQQDILPSEEGKFLVGGATDWEKRTIIGSDFSLSSNNSIGVWNNTTSSWVTRSVSNTPTGSTLPLRSAGGQVKGADATDNNDLVPLGQLNTILGDYVELTGNQTVAGVKTFTSSPIVPTATTPTQVVNKGQMDTALSAYVNAGTNNTTGGGFSLDKLVLRNSTTNRTTTVTKPNTDAADSNITIPGFGGGTKVMPISVNGVSAGPSGDITLTLEIDKFIGVTLGGSSSSVNIGFAASNPNITGYEEIEIGIQFFNKPTSVTDFLITFNNNTSYIYNSHLFNSVTAVPHDFSNEEGFVFKFNSDYGMYTFRVKNYNQTGAPRIITGTGVEVGNESTTPIPWVIGGAWHEDANVTSFQIKTVDGTTNVPSMRVTVKKIF